MSTHFQSARYAGATLLDAGHTRFRFWAPSCHTVVLEAQGHAPVAMARDREGWFECVFPCGRARATATAWPVTLPCRTPPHAISPMTCAGQARWSIPPPMTGGMGHGRAARGMRRSYTRCMWA